MGEAEFGPRKLISTAVEAIGVTGRAGGNYGRDQHVSTQRELSGVCSVLIREQDVQFQHFRIPPPCHVHLDIFL